MFNYLYFWLPFILSIFISNTFYSKPPSILDHFLLLNPSYFILVSLLDLFYFLFNSILSLLLFLF